MSRSPIKWTSKKAAPIDEVHAARKKILAATGHDPNLLNIGAEAAAELNLDDGAGVYWYGVDGSFTFIHQDLARALAIVRAIQGKR